MSVHKSGLLEKQSSTKGLLANWKKRYFVLFDDALKYYARPEDVEPKGEIPINSRSTVDLHVVKKQHSFSVESEARELVLSAPSEVAMHEWMHALQERIEHMQEVAESYDEFQQPTATVAAERASMFGTSRWRSSTSEGRGSMSRSSISGGSPGLERDRSLSSSSGSGSGGAGHSDRSGSTGSTSMFASSMFGARTIKFGTQMSSLNDQLVVGEVEQDHAKFLTDDSECFVRWIRKVRCCCCDGQEDENRAPRHSAVASRPSSIVDHPSSDPFLMGMVFCLSGGGESGGPDA